jgi:hypothetical protein
MPIGAARYKPFRAYPDPTNSTLTPDCFLVKTILSTISGDPEADGSQPERLRDLDSHSSCYTSSFVSQMLVKALSATLFGIDSYLMDMAVDLASCNAAEQRFIAAGLRDAVVRSAGARFTVMFEEQK